MRELAATSRGRPVGSALATRLFLVVFCAVLCAPAHALTNSELATVQNGFNARRDNGLAALKSYFDKHKGDAKHDPKLAEAPSLSNGTGTSAYASSIAGYALMTMWTGDESQNAAANAALLKMITYFSRNHDARQGVDNFYWWTSQLVQIITFYGSHGSRAKGRLDKITEDAAYELLWLWVKENSILSEAAIHDDYWFVWGSENHHAKRFAACWTFSLLLSKDARYRDRRYDDGHTVTEHLEAWTAFAKDYLAERAAKGLFIEAGSEYNVSTLSAIYDFYNFSEDAELKRRAEMMMTLYWASWAEEQLDGVQGGGKARDYLKWSVTGDSVLRDLSWFYFGIGKEALPDPDFGDVSFLLSDYRVPPVVLDIALDVKSRGIYEIKQWPLGLAMPGFSTPPNYHMDTKGGRILRYSYCTPSFILGTLMLEARPQADWAQISSQNRWQGVVFSGDIDARIFPVPAAIDPSGKIEKSASSYNAFWSVQSKGTLVTQKLKTNLHAGPMRIWFSHAGLGQRSESDGWVFVAARDAYAAVRIVHGSGHWQADDKGDSLVSDDELSPVILEVAQKSDFADFDAFKKKVSGLRIEFKDWTLRYTSLGGDDMVLSADYREPPRVNGKLVDYGPPRSSLLSPFIRADWNSRVVVLKKDSRQLTLDFNDAQTSRKKAKGKRVPELAN